MIQFCGQISGECKRYMLRRESRVGLIAGIITSFIFLIPVIIAIIQIHWICVLGIPVLVYFALAAGMPPSKKNHSLILPSEVTINLETETIISKSEKFFYEEYISDVVSVVDMGEWYHLYFGDKNGRFVCK